VPHLDWYIGTNILEGLAAFIFRVDENKFSMKINSSLHNPGVSLNAGGYLIKKLFSFTVTLVTKLCH